MSGKGKRTQYDSSALYIQQFIRCIYKMFTESGTQVPYIIAKWQGQKRHLHYLLATIPLQINPTKPTTIHLET